MVFLWKLILAIKVSQQVNTEVRAKKRNTQIKIVFLSTQKKKNEPIQWTFFRVMTYLSLCVFFLSSKGRWLGLYVHSSSLFICTVNRLLTSNSWNGDRWALPVQAWNYSDEITLFNLHLFPPRRCDSWSEPLTTWCPDGLITFPFSFLLHSLQLMGEKLERCTWL